MMENQVKMHPYHHQKGKLYKKIKSSLSFSKLNKNQIREQASGFFIGKVKNPKNVQIFREIKTCLSILVIWTLNDQNQEK